MAVSPRPNILLFVPHDLGDFLGCYGHSTVSTPHLDRLAREGVSFANCFTTSPECTPSRGGLMTGLYPHQNGLMGLSNFGWSLRVPHLAARLRDLGYATWQVGIQHETHDPVESLGYQHVHPVRGGKSAQVCEKLCDLLRGELGGGKEPWFACVGFMDPHRPWCRGRDSRFAPDAVGVPPWLPDHPVVRQDLARFYQDIEQMDRAVGTVLETLRQTSLDRQTLVVFTTDHGAAFPGAKATLYDPGLHVPLIVRWTGRIEGGIRHHALASNLDVLPTLLELAGGSAPPELAGRSLNPLLRGETNAHRNEVAGALFYDVAYDPMHYLRTATHKYIRSFAVTPAEAAGADPETLSTFAAGRWIRVDDFDVLTSPTWQALAPPEGAPRPEPEELYDLRSDPRERRNLVHDPAAQAVLADLRQRLRRMMEASESPLLHGHVPPPERQREACRSHAPSSPNSAATIAQRKALLW